MQAALIREAVCLVEDGIADADAVDGLPDNPVAATPPPTAPATASVTHSHLRLCGGGELACPEGVASRLDSASLK